MMLLHNKLLWNIIQIGHALLIEKIRKDLDKIAEWKSNVGPIYHLHMCNIYFIYM